MSEIVRQVVIRGRVQGVGYRAWVADEASRCGLAGWVRNRRDGAVEAAFSGEAEVVEAMIGRCRSGPALALVETVDKQRADADVLNLRHAKERFSILPAI